VPIDEGRRVLGLNQGASKNPSCLTSTLMRNRLSAARAVPRGVFQYFQSRELRFAQQQVLFAGGQWNSDAQSDVRTDYVNADQFAADSVCAEADFLKPVSGGAERRSRNIGSRREFESATCRRISATHRYWTPKPGQDWNSPFETNLTRSMVRPTSTGFARTHGIHLEGSVLGEPVRQPGGAYATRATSA